MKEAERYVLQLEQGLRLNPGRYVFLLGAGCSVSAGVPLATAEVGEVLSIASRIKIEVYRRHNKGKPPIRQAIEKWFEERGLLQNRETLYADAVDLMGGTPFERRAYLEQFFEGKRPTIGHAALASLVMEGFVRIILTTNFDPLIEMGLREASVNPVVVAHDESMATVDLFDERPKVIKLHGDYLFSNLKITERQTTELERNMYERCAAVLTSSGLVVVGFAGNDRSVMDPIEEAIKLGHLPYALRWCVLRGSSPPARVAGWARSWRDKVMVVPIEGADVLFVSLLEAVLEGEPRKVSQVAARKAPLGSSVWLSSYVNRMLTAMENESWYGRYTPLRLLPIKVGNPKAEKGQETELDISEAARIFERLVILGGPGAGKTTAVKMLAREYAKTGELLPILVELRHYGDDLWKLVWETVGGEVSEGTLRERLVRGGCLLLLDGLDEAGHRYGRLVREVREFMLRSGARNRYVITCRRERYGEELGDLFQAVEVRPLSNYAIFRLLEAEFGKNAAFAYYGQLGRVPRELYSNPLMLTLLMEELGEHREVPRNAGEVFTRFLDTFLHEWESHKHAGDVAVPAKKAVLGALAWKMGVGQTAIQYDEAVTVMARRLQKLKDESLAPRDYDVVRIVEELLVNGLLRASRGCVSFFHLTLQHYFVAWEAVYSGQSLREYVEDDDWRQIVLFAAGLGEDATELVRLAAGKGRTKLAVEIAGCARRVDGRVVDSLVRQFVKHYREHASEPLEAVVWEILAILTLEPMAATPLEAHFREVYGDVRRAQYRLGEMLARGFQPERAVECLSIAVRESPKDADLRWALAMALSEVRRHDEAIAEYEVALGLEPEDFVVCTNAALAYIRRGRKRDLRRAEDLVRRAIRLRPDYVNAHNTLGLVLWRTDREGKAIEEFKKTIGLDSRYAAPHYNLGIVYAWVRRYPEAISELETASRMGLVPGDCLYMLAEALEKSGRRGEAARKYREYVDLIPAGPDAQEALRRIASLSSG